SAADVGASSAPAAAAAAAAAVKSVRRSMPAGWLPLTVSFMGGSPCECGSPPLLRKVADKASRLVADRREIFACSQALPGNEGLSLTRPVAQSPGIREILLAFRPCSSEDGRDEP